MNRVFFIGLDGADWRIVNPLIEKGQLPNLEKIIENNNKGELLSTLPPLTGPAWSSFLTGVSPGRHGIFYWQEKWQPNKKRRLQTNSDIKAPQLPEILNKNGYSFGLLNCPFTYPVSKVDGFMISGMLSPGLDERSVYPKKIIKQLKKDDYIINVGIGAEIDSLRKINKLVDRLKIMTEKRTKTYLKLDRQFKPDFSGLVYISWDRIQHVAFGLLEKYLYEANKLNEKEKKTAKKIVSLYRLVDEGIGKISKRIEKNDKIVIISDHGFMKIDYHFNLNNILLEKNLLKIKPAISFKYYLYQVLKKMRINFFLKNIYLELVNIFDKNISKKSRFAKQLIKRESVKRGIVYDKSKVIFGEGGEQAFYFNTNLSKAEKSQIIAGLRSAISKVEEKRGEKIVEFYRTDKYYKGPYINLGPDVLLKFLNGYNPQNPQLVKGPLIKESENDWRGYHRQEGIYILDKTLTNKRANEKMNIWQVSEKIFNYFE